MERADWVTLTKSGTAHLARGYQRISYKAGDEVEVTAPRPGSGVVNVRYRGGRVFSVPSSAVTSTGRAVGVVPVGGIAPEDERIAWIFEDAGRMADRLGLCKDYDRLCDALGLPGRVRTFTVNVFSAEGIKVTPEVKARSQRLAEIEVHKRLAPEAPRVLEAST